QKPSWRASLPEAPAGAAGTIFERNSQAGQALADLIGQGKVFRLACFGAQINEKLHQATQDLVVCRADRSRRFVKDAENLAQFLEGHDATAEIVKRVGVGLLRLELAGVRETIELGQQLVEIADGP